MRTAPRARALAGAAAPLLVLTFLTVPSATAATTAGTTGGGAADPGRVGSVLLDHVAWAPDGTTAAGGLTATPMTSSGSKSLAAAATASADPCLPAPDVASLADRVVVKIPSGLPAGTRLVRGQYGDAGSWKTLLTDPPAGEWADRTVLPRTSFSYGFQRAGETGEPSCWGSGGVGAEDVVAVGVASATNPQAGLYQSDADSLWAARLGSDGGTPDTPAYSPDGRYVVYSWQPNSSTNPDLYVRQANGEGDAVQLTDTPGLGELEPAWSPDGQQVAFTSVDPADPNNPVLTLRLLDLRTGRLSGVPGGTAASHPAWDPSGTSLVATDVSSDTAPLLRITLATGERRPVAGTEGGFDPDVSPTGRIVYANTSANASATTATIETVAAAGGAPTTVATSSTDDLFSPVWSWQGQQIYWIDDSSTGSQVYLAKPDGTSVQQAHGFQWLARLGSLDLRRPHSAGTSDFTGDEDPDLLARDSSGRLWLYPITGRLTNRIEVGGGWNAMNAIVAAGDLSGDGKADVVARDNTGVLWLYRSNGAMTGPGSWLPRVRLGANWQVMNAITAPGDFDGDEQADLLARDRNTGILWLYPGTGTGGTGGTSAFGPRQKVGANWQTMNAIVGVGDVTGDGIPDIYARDGSGTLWLYPGNGLGGFGRRSLVGHNWQVMTAIAGPEVPTNATEPELLARDRSGVMRRYQVVNGRLTGRWDLGHGWNGMSIITS